MSEVLAITIIQAACWAVAALGGLGLGLFITAMLLFREPIHDPIEREFGDER